MSPRFWEIFGFDYREKKHHPSEWQGLIFQEDLQIATENFNKHVDTKGEHPYSQEVRYRHKNGSTVWVYCIGKVVEWADDGSAIRMIGTHTDITKLKKMKEKLNKTELLKSHTERLVSLGQMAGGIAHEINNPLTILQGHSEILINRESLNLSDEKVTESALVMGKTVKRIVSIVRSLNSFARDSREDSFELFEANKLIEDVLLICSDKYKRHSIKVITSKDNLNIKFFGQRLQLAQVLINLLNNAFDEIKNNDERWVEVSVYEDEHRVNLRVTNSGDLISSDIVGKIMNPFFTTKKSGEGTGMGLSISKNIVDKHLGELYLDPLNNSTSFVVSIPKNLEELI